jgi:hypothetical protein
MRRERRRTSPLTRRVSLRRRSWVLGAGSAREPRIEVINGADLRSATVLRVFVARTDDELVEVLADHYEHLVSCGRATRNAGDPSAPHERSHSPQRCQPRCEPAMAETFDPPSGLGTARMRGLGITLL